MHTTLYISCLLLLAAAMPGCDRDRDKSAGPESTVKVGFLVSGDRASYADAAGIAVDEINDGGGLLGRSLELVIRSGIEEPSVSVETAEQMIVDDEVIALIGPNRSSHAVVVGETAQRHGRPMITTSATNPDVTRAGGFVFMAAFTDLFQGGVMARFAREELGLEVVAVLTLRGEVYTEGISEIFVSGFRDSGGTVAAEEFFDRGDTDFSEPLGRLAAAGAGALFISGFVEEIALVTRQARPCRCSTRRANRCSSSAPIPGTTRTCWPTRQPSWRAASSAPTSRRIRTSRGRAPSSTRTGPGSAPTPPAGTP